MGAGGGRHRGSCTGVQVGAGAGRGMLSIGDGVRQCWAAYEREAREREAREREARAQELQLAGQSVAGHAQASWVSWGMSIMGVMVAWSMGAVGHGRSAAWALCGTMVVYECTGLCIW